MSRKRKTTYVASCCFLNEPIRCRTHSLLPLTFTSRYCKHAPTRNPPYATLNVIRLHLADGLWKVASMTELFNGFVWPVPIAFKSALEQGMFVEGDCLYDNQVAYLEPWNSARNKLKYSIQVTFPRGSSASVLPDNSRRVYSRRKLPMIPKPIATKS